MNNKLILACLFLLLTVPAVFGQTPPRKAGKPFVTAIKAGRLIDSEAGKILRNQVIIVEADKIKSVGYGTSIPKGARVIDLSDATVLPGLIDCHTHITGQASDRRRLQNPYIDPAVIAHIYLKRTLEAGFTSVRNLSAGSFTDVYLQRAIDLGMIDGPRMQAGGFYIGSTGVSR